MAIRDYRPQTTAPGPVGVQKISPRVAGDTSGVEKLGAGIAHADAVIKDAREAVELNDARLAMTKGLGDLNARLTDDQDFATMRDRYGQDLDTLEADVVAKVSSPRAQRRIQLELARGRVAAEANIYAREAVLEGGHARATLAATMRTASNAIPTAGSEGEAATIYDTTMASIGDLEAAGHLSAEQAEAMRQKFDGEVSTGLVLGAINRDPAGTAHELESPGAFGLDEVDRQRYKAIADKAAEAEGRRGKTELEGRLDTARGVLVRGGVVAADDLLQLRDDVKGTDLEVKLEGALKASAQLGRFYDATAEERAAVIAEVRDQGISVDDASIDGAYLSTLIAIDEQAKNDAAKAAREAETEAKAEATRIEREVDTVRGVLVRGGEVNAEDLARVRGEVKGTEHEAELEGALRARDRLGNFYSAPPEERAALIAAERARGISVDSADIDGAYLSTLEAIDGQARRDMTKDPVAYAIAAGVPGAAPLDLGDPASIEARMGLVVAMTDQYGAEGRVFTDAEKAHFSDLVETGSPDDQLALVVTISEGFGPGAGAVFRELGDIDPVVRRAGLLVSETGSDEVAKALLAGRAAMRAGDERVAEAYEQITQYEKYISSALQAQPGEREEVIEAVKAYYAAKAPGHVDPNKPFASRKLIQEAIHRVLGGSTTREGAFGGIQDVNGTLTRLPPALSAENAEDLLDGRDADIWRAGSLTGGLPHEGDQPVELGQHGELVLKWVSGSLYRVGVQTRRGGVEWYQDPGTSNGFFYLDLYKMAEAQMRADEQGGE